MNNGVNGVSGGIGLSGRIETVFTLLSPLSHIGISIGTDSFLADQHMLDAEGNPIKVFAYSGNALQRSQGLGRVARWTVEEWPEDLSHLRAIPDPEGDYETGIRPPYWLAWQWKRARLSEDGRLACNARLAG